MELAKPTTLSESNARRYRKKVLVYAFRSTDAITCHKSWGESAGKKGDWVIVNCKNVDSDNPDGEDVYTCDHQVFLKTYELVEGRPHVYRKTGHIWASKMTKEFAVVTMEGIGRGKQGDWLAQNSLQSCKEQWSIDAGVFERTYEPVP
eukprot:tig00021525_g22139.t1